MPSGKSGCCCHVMAVIWKLDEISRKNIVQEVDNRSCTSKLRTEVGTYGEKNRTV